MGEENKCPEFTGPATISLGQQDVEIANAFCCPVEHRTFVYLKLYLCQGVNILLAMYVLLLCEINFSVSVQKAVACNRTQLSHSQQGK